MRAEQLTAILRKLSATSGEIEAAAIISTDGLVMSSYVPDGIDDDRLGAMSAAMLSLGERAAVELGRGDLEQVLIKGRNGFIILIHAGRDAVLTVLTSQTARLGLIFLDVKRTAAEVARLI